jgi:transcriptional antiterminator RfaH
MFIESARPGDRVRLIAGPFAEQLGVLERLDGNGRVSLLLEILGGTIRLSASQADVERIRPET